MVWCFTAAWQVAGRQKTALSLATASARNLEFRSRGNPAQSSGNFRSFGGLVPGAMGQAGTQYRELAFSIGCPIKTKGEQALNKSQQYAADGRRTPFPWLLRRHSKVADVLSVICLASSLLGSVFERGLAVGFGQNTANSLSSVLTGNSLLRLWGNPA